MIASNGLRNPLVVGAVLTSVLAWGIATSNGDDTLWQFRNLGKAFYENPTTQFQAVEVFKKALDLAPASPRERLNYGLALLRAGKTDEGIAELKAVQAQAPDIPHTWFNLGIVYKKQANYAEAVKQFEQMVRLAPDEAISHYNLGVVLKLTGDLERSLEHFKRSAELDPNLAGPLFQIYNAFRAEGKTDEANFVFQKFQDNKKKQAGAAVPEDLDWSFFAEILDDVDPLEARSVPPVEFAAKLKFESVDIGTSPTGPPLGLIPSDSDADGSFDLLGWSGSGIFLARRFADKPSQVHSFAPETARQVLPADFNNDGILDFAAILGSRVALLKGSAEQPSEAQSFPLEGVVSGHWLDFDHDSDLDLFLFGPQSQLLRNNGGAGFALATDLFPFAVGESVAGASFELIKDTNATDLLVLYREKPPVLYRDRLAGKYEALVLESTPAGADQVSARDLDNDGWMDLFATSRSETFFLLNRQGKLEATQPGVSPAAGFALADLGSRGYLDVVTGSQVFQGLGLGKVANPITHSELASVVALTPFDVDADGRVDLVTGHQDGRLAVLYNRFDQQNKWLTVALSGVRNPKLAAGAEVEVKAASLYQKRVYEGIPLHFGLGSHAKVDTVRITWPNGLIQNEPEQAGNQAVQYKEKQRLSGSCPMVFAWNGVDFGFITDVLAVAPLGAAAGDGVFFQTDHNEYVQIANDQLKPNAKGLYEIRITEELREVGYLDQIRLLAVDRPDDQSVFTSERFKSPPYPEFRLYGVRNRAYPTDARDHRGNNVLAEVLRRDRKYPDGFKRDFLGVAEQHYLELDFGKDSVPAGSAALVLHGWVDWADGSTIRRLAQDSTAGLLMPYLQVSNTEGKWETVVPDMGVPAGKPKTIVIDLSGLFPTNDRRIRIVTNLCVYWDEIFLSPDVAEPELTVQELSVAQTELDHRGYSMPVVHPQRLQPEEFFYADWTPSSMWNQAQGFYTRLGDVLPLLTKVDDQFVIMGSGDELRILFSDAGLKPVAPGFTREFLLYVDGWAKDGDLNTAHSSTVEPLPFHGMSAYPYPPQESYPDTEEHRRYRETYNTRPALTTIRPLASTSVPGKASERGEEGTARE